jgi:ATP-dependent RNA helicase DeaD
VAERPFERKRAKGTEHRTETYRLAVGKAHGVKPANIVGAIINEAGLDGKMIGHIDIQEDYSLVDLPEGMPKEIFRDLQKVWVAGQQLKITRVGDARLSDPRERPVRPSERPADRPFRKTLGKPAGKPPGKPPGKPAGKPFGKPSGKPFGKTFAKRPARD